MSRFDDLVEQIAFGRELAKPATSLGLYLSPDVVYLSETHLKDGKVAVDHLVRIPIPQDAKKAGSTGTMNTDFLADPAKIAGPIRQSMSQLRWNSKNVRVTLSHHLGLLRYFPMPAMEQRFLRSAVPLEAKKYIPIPFDVLAHDFSAVPLPPDASGKGRLGVLIAVTQKNNLANVQALLAALGLKLTGLEVAPISALRLLQSIDPPKAPAPFAHVHIDGANVRVMVIDKGVPVFFREVFLPGDATVTDMRKIDLTGCLSFVQKQLGLTGLAQVRVSGNVPELDKLRDGFAAETKLPAVLQDTPKLLSIKSGDWGGYAALGASAFSLAPAAAIDLAAADRVTDEERHVARDVMILGAVLAVLFAAAGLFKSATYTYRAQELHRYEAKIDPDIKDTLGSLDGAAIDMMLKDMQSQLDQIRSVTISRHPKVSVVMKEVIDSMPERVWLEHISVANPLYGADKTPLSLSLMGHAQDKSVADEQSQVFQFKENLIRNPIIGKAFEISLSVQKQSTALDDAASAAGGGMDPKTLAEKFEERTSFTLEMKSKR
ncbi:MAG: pilus assembly protein PilM [Elusimicrobia bacterium]|nr:pilus assembly protein PilM [Elusimicrobiota bacterium]